MATIAHLFARHERRIAFHLALLLLLTLIPAAAAPHTQAAPPQVTANELVGSVDWDDDDQNVTRSNIKSFFPWTAVDGTNHTHIVYGTEEGTKTRLFYVNDLTGSFSAPLQIENELGTNRDPFFALAVGPGNVLHLLYSWVGKNAHIYYRQAVISGTTVTWSSRIAVGETSKSYAAHIYADKQGNAHMVWIDKRCGEYTVVYRMRRASDGALLGESQPFGGSCKYENRPQVAVTDDGKVHIIFQHEGEVYYARKEGSGWVRENISRTSNTNSANPSLTTDGVGVYVAWDEGVNGHDIRFRRSADGGQTWSSTINISSNSAYASFPNVTWSPSAQRVYIVWTDATQSNKEIWFREFDPKTGETGSADRVSHRAGDSLIPVIAASTTRVDTVWQDKSSNVFQVYRWKGTVTGTRCDGTLSLNGGSGQTTSRSVPAAISTECQAPTGMQIAVDEPLTDSTPIQPYQASFNVTIPNNNRCTHTVSARLIKNDVKGQISSASIMVDDSVEALVQPGNPYMLGNAATPPADGKSPDGDPGYTRILAAFMRVLKNGDCSNVTTFSLAGLPEETIANNIYQDITVIPGTITQGIKAFRVTVKDQMGNIRYFPSNDETYQLIYDTTPPELSTASNPQISGPATANNIIVTLTFSNTYVTDNLYGIAEGLPNTARFWGVMLANSTQPGANPATLNWSPVHVINPGPDFSVEWSLFSGMNYGSSLGGHDGDYYIYAKFIDGAGNVSSEMITRTVTLEPDYSMPATYTPLIMP